jgi:hypothetical protein
MIRNTKKQIHIIQNKKKNQPFETDPEIIQIIEMEHQNSLYNCTPYIPGVSKDRRYKKI